jgi:SAM-dependent methyltransferase
MLAVRRAPRLVIRRIFEIWGPILIRWPRRFGLFETILYLRIGSLEWLRRHRLIIGQLERIRKAAGEEQLRVLDFGGLSGSLAHAIRLYGLTRRYEIHVADIEREAIAGIVLRPPLAGKLASEPAPPLPYADRSFDVVASSDVFEHIPPALRGPWAGELARVALLGQVHTIPCDSSDKRWDSSTVDREFASWYKAAVGEPERWTMEHIANGLPTIDELTAAFHPNEILGLANTTIWMDSMRVQYGPPGWFRRFLFITGYIARRRTDERPPFKGCLIVVAGAQTAGAPRGLSSGAHARAFGQLPRQLVHRVVAQ